MSRLTQPGSRSPTGPEFWASVESFSLRRLSRKSLAKRCLSSKELEELEASG